MSCAKPLMAFAVNDCGAIVSIEHVDRGAACGCFCPACGEPVIAKQGDVKTWHFAHTSGNDCAAGAETALHRAAKQIIFERRELMLPAFTVTASARGPYSGRIHHAEAGLPEALCPFEHVLLEQPMASIIPDAVGIAGGGKLLIEVAVTNPVCPEKLVLIEQLNFPAVEITLHQDWHINWNWDRLYDEVIVNTTNKSWLFHPDGVAFQSEAEHNALQLAAAELPPQPKKESQSGPKLTKLWFRGKPVRLTEFPFGLVAWSPYDPVINEILKCFGAKWQPRYRNWLLSLKVKDELIQAFH